MLQDELEANPSRRALLAGVAVAVSLPLVEYCATAPAQAATQPWVPTVKPADLADGAFRRGFEQYKLVLARQGKSVYALNTVCTHKKCTVKPGNATETSAMLICPCHRARYDLTGAVVHGPAQRSLARYPIRLSAAGVIEVDVSHMVPSDDPSATLTLPDAAH